MVRSRFPAPNGASREASAQVRLRLVCFITAVCGGMRHWLPNDCALEGRAGDTVLSVPFHPRLCKLHLLKRKVFQYVVSFKGGEKEKPGWGLGMGPSSFWLPQLLLADLKLVHPCYQWVVIFYALVSLMCGIFWGVRGWGRGVVIKPWAYLKGLLTAPETDDVSLCARLRRGSCGQTCRRPLGKSRSAFIWVEVGIPPLTPLPPACGSS